VVYLAGIIGFILGFLAGQIVLMLLLRGHSRQDILEMMKDKQKKFKYGLLNWGCAIGGSWLAMYVYKSLTQL